MDAKCDECKAFNELGVKPVGRREFIRHAAFLSASGIFLLSPYAWAARAPGGSPSRKRLVVIFLRGAVDGLNVVVPHGDAHYYDARPTIAIPRRGGDGAVLNLDGHFGLHPALNSIMPEWHDGTLAFIHACGSPDPTRSHFDAQDYMESGTPGVKATPDGWLDRVLARLPRCAWADRGGQPWPHRAANFVRTHAGRKHPARTRRRTSDAAR